MKRVSRREFVKQSSAALAATSLVSLVGCSKQEAAATKTIPLGVQLYSVRTECEKDFPGTLQTIAKIGYDGVEFAGFYGYEAAEIKQLLDENGLKCCGSHTQLTALSPENFEATVEFNKTIGNKYLVVPWLPEEMRSDWTKLQKSLTSSPNSSNRTACWWAITITILNSSRSTVNCRGTFLRKTPMPM